MSDWMGRLPSSVRKKPFCTICIPGSHDSGAYWFNLRLGYAHDQSFLKYIRYFRCGFVKRIVKRWGLTQTMTIDEQLLAGIRYFDLRLELSIDGESNSQQEGAVEVVDASRKNCFIIHALYSVSWLKIANQVVNFLTDHESEIVILNVNHVYCMSEYDFRRFFLHPLTNIAARQGLQLCSTLVDLRTISLDELLEKNYRLIVVGPGDQDIDGCCFRSSMIQNRWPNKNNLSDLLSFMQAQIHAPISPGIRVMQGVLTPTLSDIVRNFRKSLRKRFSLPCRQALKHWISELDAEERDHLNVLISDQVDPEFCRLVFNLNVVDYPGIRLENVFSRISKKSIGELRWDNMRTYPTPPESYKKDRSAISNMHDDEEPDIIIEEIFESDDHPSQSLPPKKPIRTSVMIQQIEMVLMNDTSSEENVSVAPSPIPPPKPKRFSQRIPIIMEVEPIPDDAIIVPIPDAPMIPLSRSSDTPVRIALPVTAEELRLAALGQYPRYGSQMSSQRSSRVVSEERPKSAEDNEEDHSTADELCPLIPPKLDNMVESLVNHSTSDAMDNLAHRFKTSMPFE